MEAAEQEEIEMADKEANNPGESAEEFLVEEEDDMNEEAFERDKAKAGRKEHRPGEAGDEVEFAVIAGAAGVPQEPSGQIY